MGHITKAWIEHISSINEGEFTYEEITKLKRELKLKCYEFKLDNKSNYYTENIEDLLSDGVEGKLYGLVNDFSEIASHFPDVLFEVAEESKESDGVDDLSVISHFFNNKSHYSEKAKIEIIYPEFNKKKMKKLQ